MPGRILQMLRNLLISNWLLKLPSLILAVMTFYAISRSTGFEIPYTVPVEVEIEKGVAVLDRPETVEVTLRGSEADIRDLDRRYIKAVVRPKARESSGSEQVTISRGDIKGVSGVRVVRIRPEVIEITFDHEIEKTFRVLKPRAVGAPTYGKVEIDYEPKFVKINGPRRWLQDREVVETEPVDVSGSVMSFSRRVKVLSPSDTGVMTIQPPEITATVNLVTESGAKTLTNTPVRAFVQTGTLGTVSMEPATVDVTLRGSEQVLLKLAADNTKAFVDCSSLVKGQAAELPVLVHCPQDVDVAAEAMPSKVRATLSE